MKKLCILMLGFALTACGEKIKPQPEEGSEYAIPAFTWHVEDMQQLRHVYASSGEHIEAGDRLHGFVGTRGEGVVVYTLPPKTVDDSVACTLGHEVMHLALGNYHK